MRAKRSLSRGDVDFEWVKKEPAHVLALAAWYEYARESKPLIERVNALRRAKLFASADDADLGIIKAHCTQHLSIIPLYQIYILQLVSKVAEVKERN